MKIRKCKVCGTEEISKFISYRANICKKCYSKQETKRIDRKKKEGKTDHYRINSIYRNLIHAKIRSKKKGISFTIDDKFIDKQLLKQKGRCYYSGIELKLDKSDKKYSVSLERIDNTLGYTPENTVLVCNIINSMKSNLSLEEFEYIIEKLSNRLILNKYDKITDST